MRLMAELYPMLSWGTVQQGIYVYVYTCMPIYIYDYTFVFIHVLTFIYMHRHLHVSMFEYIHMCIFMDICMHICLMLSWETVPQGTYGFNARESFISRYPISCIYVYIHMYI
jgi:hypothetical protein